ncbi:MAG TPA: DAK2 domain-containing protein [Thermomicrobiales bacterium]|nr:DAK2 domain-containing protein [Thermomicrobiales bacterium]
MNSTTSSQAVWNGQALRDAFTFASALIQRNRDRVNQLNVFPVPDGDTGTNMALTMTGALEVLEDLPETATASEVANRVAYGALMGARGNSGVILSQIFRGFANGLNGVTELSGGDLAKALDGARETAYKAVMRPVEGTMLTVIRGAAEGASEAAKTHRSVTEVLRAAHEAAQVALDGTPQQLDILRQAGVVDAGGQGVVIILEALLRSATGDTELPTMEEAGAVGGDMAFLDMVEETHGEDTFGYCTNFMVLGSDIDAEKARDEIAAMGESAVIVGDDSMLKVHIHTLDPGGVLQYGIRLGELDQIKIDNMSKQTETLQSQRAGTLTQNGAPPPEPEGEQLHNDLAIIVVAAGEGISTALRSLGATSIVQGGQTMNPSTQELLAAVEDSAAEEIILLPNNKNIHMAANQVAELSEKTVRIVPTRSIPAALAALTAFNTDQSLDENVDDMAEAMTDTTAIAITRAVRDAEISGIAVATGQTIGLINDELAAAGDDELQVVLDTFERANVDDPELLTIFVGESVPDDEAETLQERLGETWPDAEIEMHNGGQPHYRYIISAE